MKMNRVRSSSHLFRHRLARLTAPSLFHENQQLASLIEQASDGIFVADLNGRYTYVNAAGCRMLGYTGNEILGKTILDLIPPEEAPRLMEEKATMVQGRKQISEWTLRRKDGGYIPVEVSAKIFSDGRWQGFVRDISERKRIAQELQETVFNLSRAQAVVKTGSWRLDIQQNKLIWTEENYRIFGVPPGKPMTYQDFLALVHPNDRAYVDEKWQAALRGEPYSLEHRIVVGDDMRWVREEAELQFDANGKLLGGIGTTQDITERKLTEEALQKSHESERRLRAELEQVTTASFTISEVVASLSNAEVSAVLQAVVLQAKALTGAQYVALGVGGSENEPFDPWVFVGMSQEVAKGIGRLGPRSIGTLGLVAREGMTLREKDLRKHPAFHGFPAGHPDMQSFLGVPIRFRGAPVGNLYLANKLGAPEFTDQDVRVIQMLAMRVGVAIETATLYRGEALRRTWLQTVINQMPEGVVLLDENGHVSATNEALMSLSCGDTGTIDRYGNPVLFDFRLPDGNPIAIDELPMIRALQTGESIHGRELTLRLKDGRLVPVLINAAPVRGAKGEIVGASAIIQDISKMKEAERMREEWASIIAHDLRQPVSAISLAAEMLKEFCKGDPNEKEQKLIVRIRENSHFLKRMISELLDASQIETRRLTVQPRAYELVKLIRDIVERHNDEAQENQAVVESTGEITAFIDIDRIRQVMGNLLSNAVKYGKAKAPIIVTILDRADEAEVVVTNTGPGISREELSMVFGRFARSRGAKESRVPGLGLGLYISHGLIEAQGGKMWVESIPGATTSFHFTVCKYERT